MKKALLITFAFVFGCAATAMAGNPPVAGPMYGLGDTAVVQTVVVPQQTYGLVQQQQCETGFCPLVQPTRQPLLRKTRTRTTTMLAPMETVVAATVIMTESPVCSACIQSSPVIVSEPCVQSAPVVYSEPCCNTAAPVMMSSCAPSWQSVSSSCVTSAPVYQSSPAPQSYETVTRTRPARIRNFFNRRGNRFASTAACSSGGLGISDNGGLAQQKSNTMANRGIRGHVGGSLGGYGAEGVGWSTRSAQDAIQNTCYWGERPVGEIGVSRGANGWYSTVLYR